MKNRTTHPVTTTRYLRLGLIILLLLGLSLACNLPGGGTSPNVDQISSNEIGIETAVAQTMAVRAAESPQNSGDGDTPIAPPSATTSPSNTPTPGPTATPTLTPTNTSTPTSEVPMVKVSVSTNCRQGPGKVYDQLGVLLVGEEAEVIAKEPQESDWYIRNPDKPGGFCWIWGNYATISGNTDHLPVYTPPPTPTPSLGFSVSFHDVETCGNWYIEFYIENNGGIILQSVTTTVTDNDTAQTVNYTNNNFIGGNGCGVSSDQKDLIAGENGYTLSGWLNNNPAGHNLHATITICTENGLGGTCITKNLNFTP